MTQPSEITTSAALRQVLASARLSTYCALDVGKKHAAGHVYSLDFCMIGRCFGLRWRLLGVIRLHLRDRKAEREALSSGDAEKLACRRISK